MSKTPLVDLCGALRRTVLLIVLAAGAACRADAADILVLSGNGARGAVRALTEEFERTTGHKVTLHFEVNAAIKRKIDAGAEFDAVVLNPPVIEALEASGKIEPGTRADIGRAGLGVGIRTGAPRPDISSVAAFRSTLLAANAVAYPGEGASGIYFAGLVDRLGITEQMKAKLKPMPAEDTVEVVARGEADMVVVVASRIAEVPGVELVGAIPAELQTRIGFAAAVGSAPREPAAARDFVRFVAAPDRAALLKRLGVEPAH
ncbi:MAG: substrate-binding domain-containing protein [Pseudolabrys sp.]|nr:substrate-binding domain-containing protein [Pseudolabrys sp.]